MKKIIFLNFILFIFCSSISAQWVSKKAGEQWGEKENRYAELGNKTQKYIEDNMFMSAVECLNEMVSLKSKNQNIEKDIYSLQYCYFSMKEFNAFLKIAEVYERAFPDSPRAGQVIGNIGFVYASEIKDFKKAIEKVEKAYLLTKEREYNIRAKYLNLIAECYFLLGNNYQSKQFYKKSVQCLLDKYKINISYIENNRVNMPDLGEQLYLYMELLAAEENYKGFTYLMYLSAMCGYQQALKDNPYVLTDKTVLNGHPTDLFLK